MTFMNNGRITINNCTDCVLGRILWTEAVLVVFKRDFTVMDCTAWTANGNTINNNHPDFLTIPTDMQTFYAKVVQLWLALDLEAKIRSLECFCKMVLLCTSVGHLQGL